MELTIEETVYLQEALKEDTSCLKIRIIFYGFVISLIASRVPGTCQTPKLPWQKAPGIEGRDSVLRCGSHLHFFSLLGLMFLVSQLGLVSSLWVLTFRISSSKKAFLKMALLLWGFPCREIQPVPPGKLRIPAENLRSLRRFLMATPGELPGWAMPRPSIWRVQRPGQRKCPIPPGTEPLHSAANLGQQQTSEPTIPSVCDEGRSRL